MSANRLSKEKSPYLLQHANNPVDWYPWGSEAFEKARKEDKPILVSIGYSTCHWCHVMERESYENPTLAALMNKHLVNIKVDREERPDVDKIYMTAVQAMTGSGGWPLNVFLTPDLKPFYGGTYFPPTSRYGHPGWGDVVTKIGGSWKDSKERKTILDIGNQVGESLKAYALALSSSSAPAEWGWLDQGYKMLQSMYDADRGGFGRAPKFPMPVYHYFLARYGKKDAHAMSFRTLTYMSQGGIYDHLGGGFARYSTDAHWHIPHFEKMLYDNAQLAVNYLEAYQIEKNPQFRRVARETLDYVLSDMTSAEGGFYSAEDADSLPLQSLRAERSKPPQQGVASEEPRDDGHKVEGAFYVWEQKEILDILGESGKLFCFVYGVREGGNAAQDPHGEFKNKNILYQAHSIAEAAREFKMTPEEAQKSISQSKSRLLGEREKRPRPHLDDKVLSAWNGLMISAFAKSYQIIGDENHLRAAQRAAQFLKTALYDPKTRMLYRRYRAGERKIPGIADDYAFVVQGLLDLYESDFDLNWLGWATELTDSMIARFYDNDHGGFFMTATDQDKHLLVRVREDQDNVEPSASSVAAMNLLRLSQIFDREDYRAKAQKTLQAFGSTLQQTPTAMPFMLATLQYDLTDPQQIVIVGKPGAADTEALLSIVRSHFLPFKILLLKDDAAPAKTGALPLPSYIQGMTPQGGKATAYVCEHYVCKRPVTSPAELDRQLKR